MFLFFVFCISTCEHKSKSSATVGEYWQRSTAANKQTKQTSSHALLPKCTFGNMLHQLKRTMVRAHGPSRRNGNFGRLQAKGQGHGKSTCHTRRWYNTICVESLLIITNIWKLSNGVIVIVPVNNEYYKQMIKLFVIPLAETPSPWCNSM